jgi:polyribonucleotide nucleotidyltransferase
MDAGVPITKPVAGISIGLVKEGNRSVLLTDIIGEEDHFGDMDFKVCGTRDGITAIQLDIKIEGIDHKIIREPCTAPKKRACDSRQDGPSFRPRAEISKFAPRLLTVKIDPEKIGKLIGPGGKNIKKLQEETGAQIDIEDDGTVYISVDGKVRRKGPRSRRGHHRRGQGRQDLRRPRREHQGFRRLRRNRPRNRRPVPRLGTQRPYVQNVTDIVNIGDEVRVKVILIDDQGRIKLSRKAAMKEEGQQRSRARRRSSPPAAH